MGETDARRVSKGREKAQREIKKRAREKERMHPRRRPTPLAARVFLLGEPAQPACLLRGGGSADGCHGGVVRARGRKQRSGKVTRAG